MYDSFLYVLQVNGALLVFYLCYRLSFTRDTFLKIRRCFLWGVFLISFVYPLISLEAWLERQPELPVAVVNYAQLFSVVAFVPSEEVSWFTWQNILLFVWGGGVGLLALRLVAQLVVIGRLTWKGKRVEWEGQRLIVLPKDMPPFSFLTWVFVNPAAYEKKELQEILIHERTHVCQWHSLDIVLGEVVCMLCWPNPVVWLFRKEIRQNLEFLADKEVIAAGYDRKHYQYHLLRLSRELTAVPIVNNFNVTPLKKRIIMMNKKQTSGRGLWKYALLLPVTGLLIVAGNARVIADTASHSGSIAVEKQQASIQGKVVDENGQSLPGVTVVVKGTSVGTMTDRNGNFVLKGYETAELIFSYVGRKTQQITCTSGSELRKIVMPADQWVMDGIVVVGYSCDRNPSEEEKEIFVPVEEMPVFAKGRFQDYLARSVKYPAKALEKGIEGRVDVSFVVSKTGKVTQVKVVQSVDESLDREAVRVISAMPDWIPGKQRGVAVDVPCTLPVEFKIDKGKTNSLTNPLIVVDGKKMPASFDLNSLAPEDIESLTVLKDATVTTIYGEAGKNGVIVVKTKKAQE